MKVSVLQRKLMRDIKHRAGSLSILVLVIGVGICLHAGMSGTYHDIDGARARFYADNRLADFLVELKRAPRTVVSEIAGDPDVRDACGRVHAEVVVDITGRSDEIVTGSVYSLPPNRAPVLNDVTLIRGTWFSHADAPEVILDKSFAEANELGPGDRIKATFAGGQRELLIVGTALSPEFVYAIPPSGGMAPDPRMHGILFLPERFLQEACDLEGSYNEVLGRAWNTSTPALETLLDRLEKRFDRWGVVNTTPAMNMPSVRYLHDEIAGLRVSSLLLPLIFIGVAALLLNIIAGRLITQQRTVIGTLKALGFSRYEITVHYLEFGVFIGALGGLAGCAAGVWLQSAYDNLYLQFYALPDIPFHFYPDIYGQAFLISVCFSAAGTLRSAMRAGNLPPALAMRPPVPTAGGKIFIERFPAFWSRLSFRGKLVARSIFRHRFRTAVSVLAAMVSTALIFMAFEMLDAMDFMIDFHFKRIALYDVSIGLRDPVGIRGVSELAALPDVTSTEPQLVTPCVLSKGSVRRRLAIIGLKGTRLYRPQDAGGRPVRIPDHGLVLTRKLAEALGVKGGGTVKVRALLGRRETVEAPVTGIADTFMGLSAYADMDYLGRLIGEHDSANIVLMDMSGRSISTELTRELKRRPKVVSVSERGRSRELIEGSFRDVMNAAIGVMVLFSGLIAFGSILNTTLVNLSERKREIGTLRVLGYSVGETWRIFAIENLLMNGVGLLIGLGAGILLSAWVSSLYDTEMYRYPLVVRPVSLLKTACLVSLFILGAQIIVYRMLKRLPWLEFLKVRE